MQQLERAAHFMKGAASNFSAHGAVSATSRLESDAKNGDLESAKPSPATLEVVIERLLPELANMCQGSAK